MRKPAILGGMPLFPEGLPFARPPLPSFDKVVERLRPVYETGMITNSLLVRELEEKVSSYFGVAQTVAVSCCTSGLLLCVQALCDGFAAAVRSQPRVVLPSFTFSATGHAVVWNGGFPVFAECNPETYQLDPEDVATRLDGADLLIGTHVAGAPCDTEALEGLAKQAGIPFLLDAAHAFGACARGRRVASFGNAEVFSMSPTKIVISGEGGLITTDDENLATHLRAARDYGNTGDYNPAFAGLNARMSELHAAIALASFDELKEHLDRRVFLAESYRDGLAELAGVRSQRLLDDTTSTYKDYSVTINAEEFGVSRSFVATALRAEGIDTRCYFSPPLHQQKCYSPYNLGKLAVTEKLSAEVLSLPIWRDMKNEDAEKVISALWSIHQDREEIEAACAV